VRPSFGDRSRLYHASGASRIPSRVQLDRRPRSLHGQAFRQGRDALDDAGVEQRFVDKGSAILAQGIFGSPQIVFRGELFWGTDRLDQLKAALTRAR